MKAERSSGYAGTRKSGRYVIVCFDPNGDMGYGTVLGPFSDERADRLSEALWALIERFDWSLQLLVLPTMPVGMASPLAILEQIAERETFST